MRHASDPHRHALSGLPVTIEGEHGGIDLARSRYRAPGAE